ncbi:MAG TPA: serine/threonine-protein kinase, partial [Polyangiaceae bacterium]
ASALHVELRQLVALKFLHAEALANPEIVARFATEARASVRIKSEHVARVFDVGTLPSGEPFMVMEHLKGKDLCEKLHDEGPFSIKVAIEYVIQVCEALAAAHSVGVVHRDIKPENLFLTEPAQGMNVVKVLDFGISKVALTGSAFDTGLPLVRTMMPMGSPVYMSPEQIRGSEDIDCRTDIWSLGCVLYELLTGVAAFDAPSLTQLSATILEKDPVPMRDLSPEIPVELETVVLKCLEKDVTKRFQNVAELAIALYRFGPRRARLSAERCALLLKGPVGAAEFELPSLPPPSFEGGHDGRTTNPTGPGVSSGPASFEPLRTSTPAAISVREPAELATGEQRPRSFVGSLALLLAAVVAGLAGGIFVFSRHPGPSAAGFGETGSTTASLSSPAPAALPPAPAAPSPRASAGPPPAAPPIDGARNAKPHTVLHPVAKQRPVQEVPARKAPLPTGRARDDTDVGF